MKKIKFYFLFIFLLIPVVVNADSARSTIVMDVNSGRILYQNNINEKRLIASITKIMTCIIVLENSDINEDIKIGDEVIDSYGTNIYIEPGEIMKIKDLLYGLMLRSGNDAATTLAFHTLGEKEFVDKMNEKAKELGMNNTVFNNPHGLDEKTKNYSTAHDMALLAKYAYKNNKYREIISTRKYVTKSSIKSYVWYNRMSLLTNYKKCIGGKNGYTPRAGKTLVSYAKDNDLVLTIISLGDSSIYENHQELYDYYFSKYKNYLIVDKNRFKIDSFSNDKKYYLNKSFSYPLRENELDKVQTLVKINPSIDENKCGFIEVKLEDGIIGKVYIYQKNIQKKEEVNFLNKIKKLIIR